MVQLASKVASFLSRDDNSRKIPGKKDGRGQIQNRVLNDYRKNLHLKFLAENPEIKVSTVTFSKLRPSSIKLCNFLSKNTCLCTKHQNFALKCKCLQSYKVTTVINPDSFSRTHDDKAVTDMLTNIKEENIVYNQWKRVKVDIGGNVKEKTGLVQIEVPTEEFRGIFMDEMTAFREHAERVKIQYKAMKDLKVQLLPTQCIIQMDFAEDYHCQNNDEVQNAYFGAGNVTIFPAVVYYRDAESAELLVKSIAFISDEGSHDSYAVHAILDKLLPIVKQFVPDLKQVFYWTDSPTSQFRNKTIFHIISEHKEEYNCVASWNYFEAGHGKGPCYGVGRTVKRLADDYVKAIRAATMVPAPE